MTPSQYDLKETALSLKDSSLEFLKSKSELASIEAKEAADFAKKKVKLAAITGILGFFSYVILLLLLHSLLLHFGSSFLNACQRILPLSHHEIVLVIFLFIHSTLFIFYLRKLRKKSTEEFFPLTKSEFKKDQAWLKEMNNEN